MAVRNFCCSFAADFGRYTDISESIISNMQIFKHLPFAAIFTAFLLLLACGQGGNQQLSPGGYQASDSGFPISVPFSAEYFHADNDIAMTVRSIADAIKEGEPLDSAEYDFEGVLTDGQGTPLYTDVQGSPGLWQVDVLDHNNVMIRNLYLGDLLPIDLRTYLLQSLRIDDTNRLDYTVHDAVDDDETEIAIYHSNGVYLRFEVRAGIAPNGLEGPQMSIVMSADPPAGAETRNGA